MNFNQLRTFICVVEKKGFTAAARMLNISPVAVSKQIKSIESLIGMTLIHRTTTHFRITNEGLAFYERCKQVIDEVNCLNDFIHFYNTEPTGRLNLFSTISFGEKFVMPYVTDFSNKYPGIRLKIEIADRIPDVQNEEYDICMGLASHWDNNLIQKKLLTTTNEFWAAPAYLEKYGQPISTLALNDHRFVLHSHRPDPFTFTFQNGAKLQMQPAIMVNNYHALLDCALQGMGIISLYNFTAHDFALKGTLRKICLDQPFPATNLYGYYAPGRMMKKSTRAFLDFLQSTIKAHAGIPAN